jgi:hypothetical protein
MPASPAPLRRRPTVDPHGLPSQCPYCDQPIPVERADEIRHRIETREREQAETLSAEIRQELVREKAQGEAAVREKVATLESANAALRDATNKRVAAAEQQTRAALSQYEAIVADQERILAQRLQEQAELIQREKQEAVNAVNAKHFEETQRLTGKLEDLARQLERKTANELGEGAEIDLFESLKQEFEGDMINGFRPPDGGSSGWTFDRLPGSQAAAFFRRKGERYVIDHSQGSDPRSRKAQPTIP